jgi:hypothetical protein
MVIARDAVLYNQFGFTPSMMVASISGWNGRGRIRLDEDNESIGHNRMP